ncbi:MAG: sel1 repeat family protein [Cyanobacteria bacterium P01_F01_bin.53]
MSVPGIEEFRAQDYAEALPLLTHSAAEGDAEAQCMLGNIYQLGLGDTAVNEAAAMHWYYRAANQGYSVATNNLAGMVWPISSEAAAALHQLANQQGFSEAPAKSAPAKSA